LIDLYYFVYALVLDEEDHSDKISIVNEQRLTSQQSNNQISNNNNSTSSPKRPKTGKKKHTIFVDLSMGTKVEPITTETNDNTPLERAITVQNYGSNTTDQSSSSKIKRRKLPTNTINLQSKKTPSVVRRPSVKFKDNITEITTAIATEQKEPLKEEPLKEQPIIDNKQDTSVTNVNEQVTQEVDHKRIKKGAFDSNNPMADKITSEIKMLGSRGGVIKKTRFHLEKENKTNEVVTESTPENQETLDLLEKIQNSATGISIGKMSISKQVRLYISIPNLLFNFLFLFLRVVVLNYHLI